MSRFGWGYQLRQERTRIKKIHHPTRNPEPSHSQRARHTRACQAWRCRCSSRCRSHTSSSRSSPGAKSLRAFKPSPRGLASGFARVRHPPRERRGFSSHRDGARRVARARASVPEDEGRRRASSPVVFDQIRSSVVDSGVPTRRAMAPTSIPTTTSTPTPKCRENSPRWYARGNPR